MFYANGRQLLVAAVLLLLLSCIAAVVFNNMLLITLPLLLLAVPLLAKYAINKTETIFWIVVFLLPLSTELNITPSLGLDFPDEALLIILTALFIIKAMHKPVVISTSIIKQPLFLLLLLHLLWVAVASVYSTNQLISVKFLAAKIWYVVPFALLPFFILTSAQKIKLFAWLLLLPMLFVAVQCMVRHSFYGFSFDMIKRTLSPFFRNHVNYSGMLVCMLPIVWSFIKLTPVQKKKHKWLYLMLVVLLAALVLSYSRGAWAAVVISIAGAILMHYKKIGAAILILAVAVSISIAWLSYSKHYLKFAPDYNTTIFHTNFSEHLKATVTLKDVSNAERFYRWVAAANMVKAHPVAGFGPNTFYDNYKMYSESIFKTWVSRNNDHSSVHNYFLLTALEQGIVGLIIFIVLFVVMLLQLQQLYHQLKDKFYKQVAIATTMVLITIGVLNFLSDLIETDKIGSLFWLCLGMIFLLKEKIREDKMVII